MRKIFQRLLVEARTEGEIAELLAVTKPQAKAWLNRMIDESVLEKVSKPRPVRYRAIQERDRLFGH